MAEPDTLSLCANANAAAGFLDEAAEIKRTLAKHPGRVGTGLRDWSERLARWAASDDAAAKQIRELVAEVERLRKAKR